MLSQTNPSRQTLTPDQCRNLLGNDKRVQFLDVRTRGEYSREHVHGTVNVPLGILETSGLPSWLNPNHPVMVLCQSGARSSRACTLLQAAGCTEIVETQGGLTEWVRNGLPVVNGSGVISLDRQVRIVAGGLIVCGSLAAWYVSPICILLVGAIGAGLVIAGVTNTCGMAMLLEHAPWNRAKAGAGEAGNA